MTYHDDHASDDQIATLGDWQTDETPETYRCPSCGLVDHGREWHWYGYSAPDRDDPTDDGDVTCTDCDGPLSDGDIVDGHGCGDCGRDVCETGTDYCKPCNDKHDAAEQADPLHHHVWQSASDFELTVREITREQVRR